MKAYQQRDGLLKQWSSPVKSDILYTLFQKKQASEKISTDL